MGIHLDELLLLIPILACLVVCMFRLDELMVRPGKTVRRPAASRDDENGMPMLIDPDGRAVVYPSRSR